MESNDIRDEIDIVKHPEVAADILKLRPPPPTKIRRTSGLDCLVTVLRRIYALTMLGPAGIAQHQDFKDAEESNPILKHSWLIFGMLDGEGRERATHVKAAVWNHIGDLMEKEDRDCSFKSLCMSNLMVDTFWSLFEFRLYGTMFRVADQKLLDWEPRKNARESLLRLDLTESPDMTLQDLIDETHGIGEHDGEKVAFLYNQPWVVRVLYVPGHAPEDQRLPFSHVRYFEMPLCRYRGDTEERRYLDLSATSVCYSLIAVVRLREKESDTDFVRTYSTSGACILPTYEPTSFMKSSWSLEDSHAAEYMLFFGWSGLETPDMGYPEAAAPEPYDPEVVRITELLHGKEGERVRGDVLDGDILPHGTSQQQSLAISNIAPIAEGDGAALKSQRNSQEAANAEPNVGSGEATLPVVAKINSTAGDRLEMAPKADDSARNLPAEKDQGLDGRSASNQESGSQEPTSTSGPAWQRELFELARQEWGEGLRRPERSQPHRTQQGTFSNGGRGSSQPRGQRTRGSGRGDRSWQPTSPNRHAHGQARQPAVGRDAGTPQYREQRRALEPHFSTLRERSPSHGHNRNSHDRDRNTSRRSHSRDRDPRDVDRQRRRRSRSRSPPPRASDRQNRRRSRSPRESDRRRRYRSRSPRARDRQSEQPDLAISRHEGRRNHRSSRNPRGRDRRNR